MAKAIIIFSVVFLLPLSGQAQNWTTIDKDDLGVLGSWWGRTDGANRGFNINKEDNSIWMLFNDRLTSIDGNGLHQRIDLNNHQTLPSGSYIDFAFVGSNTYLLDAYSGLYLNDGTDWSVLHNFMWGADLDSANDTIWIGKSQDFTVSNSSNGVFQSELFDAVRVRKKNGISWYTNGTSGIYRYYSGQYGEFQSTDTSILLSYDINDLKFSPYTDSFFLAGDKGISIANSTHFVDSISQFNTTNMPIGTIEQFEFDQNGNIWAIFGDNPQHNSLAFLDRSTMNWSQYYDSSNSPIDFPPFVGLELDSFGNVWIAEASKLHCLKIGTNTPSWLSVKKIEAREINIYPNPSAGNFTIQLENGVNITDIEVLDLDGRLIESLPYTEQIDLNSSKGIYMLRLMSNKELIGTKRIVIH